jgi:hypothetical protein
MQQVAWPDCKAAGLRVDAGAMPRKQRPLLLRLLLLLLLVVVLVVVCKAFHLSRLLCSWLASLARWLTASTTVR